MSQLGLTPELASRLAQIALDHVERGYPFALQTVLGKKQDLVLPAAAHPVFHGSFDWHSCVHAHWLLARLLRRFPELAEAKSIRALFDRQFTEANIAGELATLRRPEMRGFERPYGWAWALMLASEFLRQDSAEAGRWSTALTPLASHFVQGFRSYLPLADYPVRAGIHSNSAFALMLMLDYADVADEAGLLKMGVRKSLAWYGEDSNCQAWEPSQDDFLSSALMEAALMAIVLGDVFQNWFNRYLPSAPIGEPATLFAPARVSDRSDGKIAHLDGLNLSRAWCWRLIARVLREGHPAFARAEEAAALHLESALPHVAGDYAGEHWLASFALLALDPWPEE